MNSNDSEAAAVMESFSAVPVVRCYCDRELTATPGDRRMTCPCGRHWRELGGPVAGCSWLQWALCDKNWQLTWHRGRAPVTLHQDANGEYAIRDVS